MDAIWEIIVKPAWYWTFTIVPAVLGVIAVVQESQPASQRGSFMTQVYNLLAYWAWFIIAAIAFVVTVLISAVRYVEKHRQENKHPVISAKSEKQSGGNNWAIENLGTLNLNQAQEKVEKPEVLKLPKSKEPLRPTVPLDELEWTRVIVPHYGWYDQHMFTDASVRFEGLMDFGRIVADLAKVDIQSRGGRVPVDINWLNPAGQHLSWGVEGDKCFLRIVREGDTEAKFMFQNDRRSPPLNHGTYEVEVVIVESSGNRKTQILIKGVLKIKEPHGSDRSHVAGLEWLG